MSVNEAASTALPSSHLSAQAVMSLTGKLRPPDAESVNSHPKPNEIMPDSVSPWYQGIRTAELDPRLAMNPILEESLSLLGTLLYSLGANGAINRPSHRSASQHLLDTNDKIILPWLPREGDPREEFAHQPMNRMVLGILFVLAIRVWLN
ncbi:hypothetical protein BS47DRAFT_1400248 [Hydnum rufescens UP504]|uniref:Uncharacterized protein n=1 Tax=Hydnum rufescens UP504 TaxID=1448309 RepID=A0A9P6AH45_9AGAM|nr:hypothetical protein BS47DRAFT_1400248 [Hydnum rufescens UP504]